MFCLLLTCFSLPVFSGFLSTKTLNRPVDTRLVFPVWFYWWVFDGRVTKWTMYADLYAISSWICWYLTDFNAASSISDCVWPHKASSVQALAPVFYLLLCLMCLTDRLTVELIKFLKKFKDSIRAHDHAVISKLIPSSTLIDSSK